MMSKTPRAQELNAPILRLARDKGTLADKELHKLVARDFGIPVCGQPVASVDQMMFSASVNLAKRRLVRYGLLTFDEQRRVSITAQGELFLARGFTRLDASVRKRLDEAWLNVDAHDDALALQSEDMGSLHELLADSKLEYHALADGAALVPLWSDLRSWIVEISESNGWICLRSHVMGLPDRPGARMALVDAAMRANAELTSWGFSIGSNARALFLEAECRAENISGEDLAGIVFLIRSVCEEQYASLVKVALAPSPLDALEAAFKRSA